ncbi:hypothetical protein [Gimesia fumaroli]|uniref:Uncharacterized protein n=1 Tax=Gimesia fumaroli TaxID=2527976 RepID=A0A518I5R0_9PLAN|nr:hypothetical protein [Gimesia fumaroli]QDV48444.1 hypothetical protein Enr17x_04560 [Gimesia fumaroli]
MKKNEIIKREHVELGNNYLTSALVFCFIVFSFCWMNNLSPAEQDQAPSHSGSTSKKYLTQKEKLRAAFIAASPGEKKGEAARRFFENLSAQDINRLCFDNDNSVALYAAWRKLELQLTARLLGPERGANIIYIPPGVSHEFLGFVEGRLQVPVPNNWCHNLLSARYGRWGATLFSMKHSPHYRPEGEIKYRQGEGESALPNVYLHLNDKDPSITFIGRGLDEGIDAGAKLPKEVEEKIKNQLSRDTVTGIAIKGRAVIALEGKGPDFEQLICIATRGSKDHPKVLWQCQMDSYWARYFQGQHWFTEFRVKDDHIYLFHCTHTSIGIECISFKDGSRIFSFNSRLPTH